jgi:hypothetical protein
MSLKVMFTELAVLRVQENQALPTGSVMNLNQDIS